MSLDRMFQPWLASLAGHERAAFRRWQGTDRFYREIQAAALGDDAASDEAFEVLESLLGATNAPLAAAVTMWRGVRSCQETFGVEQSRLGEVVGHEDVLDRFLACSADVAVAQGQFTTPEMEGGSVLLRLRVGCGVRCGWVSLAGDPTLREQYELLVRPGATLRIVGVARETPPIVEMEVS